MKKIQYIIIGWCFLMGGLIACSNEGDSGATADDGMRTLSIEIGAEGSLKTKAFADDENAYEHEFMNELCVFVVDANGTIEKKFLYSGTTHEGTFTGEPADGNASEWRSEDFELPTGNKTIYAFANWSGVNNDSWNEIINKTIGSQLTDTNLSTIEIDDPAGNINFGEGKYIPMSVKYGPFDFQVSQTARVELVRLVGRIDGTITNNRTSDITVNSVTMSPFATSVPLMPQTTYQSGVTDNTVTYTFENGQAIEPNGTHDFHFYVNETENDNTFNISVALNDGSSLTGRLQSTNSIPRNNFLPLSLNISDNDVFLYIMAYINPIGGYPVPVIANQPLGESEATAGLYSATLPEGCSFQVFGTTTEGTATEAIACSLALTVSDSSSPIAIDADDNTWAHITSLNGQQETLRASFNVNGTSRTADLSITTEPLKDLDDYFQTNSLYLRSWTSAPLWYEPIQLTTQQEGRK